VRGLARYLSTVDPSAQIPPTDLLAGRSHRATPYPYSDGDVAALMEATRALRTPLRKATYYTLVGLLAVTGMRVGEAIRLDRDDVDWRRGVVTIRETKFNKTREIPLHPTTKARLADYDGRREALCPRPATRALFVSTAGTRLLYCGVHWTWLRLVRMAGLEPRSPSCRPRIHDLRHRFAVRTLIGWYRDGGDVQARLPLLSTLLGHVDPTNGSQSCS
ncbi:MAG TPA: tyrosine-type recombinase/integrase, partial [Acidimicrobiales bacterium]|nr:tyrosine-type recombinase/integrase [Acidimicrobiales bacterium]